MRTRVPLSTRPVIAALATSILSGCQTMGPATDVHAPTSAEIAALQTGITLSFIDPGSTQVAAYTNVGVIAVDGAPVKVICLLANAKNRMGGYTGMKVTKFFMSLDDRFLFAEDFMTKVCDSLGLAYPA